MEGVQMMTSTQLSNQEPYLIIHADGRITVSEKLQPSETAARVLECMKTQWMEDSQSKQIRELQERIKRLEESENRMLNWLTEDCPESVKKQLSNAWMKSKEAKP
jgi:hypothetical protein